MLPWLALTACDSEVVLDSAGGRADKSEKDSTRDSSGTDAESGDTGPTDGDGDGVPATDDCDDGDPSAWTDGTTGELRFDGATEPCLGYCNLSVNGDLLIDAEGMDLGSLQCVTEVAGDVWIQGDLVSLRGLDRLVFVGGDLYVYYLPTIRDLDGLQGLRTLGGGLAVLSNDSLERIEPLAVQGDVASLTVAGNPLLESLAPFAGITEVSGSMYIAANDSLEDLSGLEQVERVSGRITVRSNSSLGSAELGGVQTAGELFLQENPFLSSFSGPQEVLGDAEVSDNALLNELDRGTMRGIGGGLTITNNDSLTSLAGLRNLATVGGTMFVHDNDSLLIAAAENLESAHTLAISDNYSLQSLSFPSLSHVLEHLYVVRNPALAAPGRLGNSLEVGGWVHFVDNALQLSFEGLDLVDTGAFEADNLPSLISFQGLETLQHADELVFRALPVLESCEGFGQVVAPLYLEFWQTGAQDMTGLSSVETLTWLYIEDTSVVTLDGLSMLREVSDTMEILDNGALTDVTALYSLESVGGDIVITNNPSLGSEAAAALVDEIEMIGGSVTITP